MAGDLFFSIVIVSLNGESSLPRALDSLRRLEYRFFETIVVDNGSTDGTARVVRDCYPEVRLIQSPVNLGFAGGNNLGLRAAHGDILVLLNDDTEMFPDALGAWARVFGEDSSCGVAGAKLYYPDGNVLQHAGGLVEPNGATQHFGYGEVDDGRFDSIRACAYVTGAALAFRRELLDRVGLLDAGYYPIYFEETDYCCQAWWEGWRVLYVPGCRVYHFESRTQKRFSLRFLIRYTRSRMRFLMKCFGRRDLLRAAKYEFRWWFQPGRRSFVLPYLIAYGWGLAQLPGNLRARAAVRRRYGGIPPRPAV